MTDASYDAIVIGGGHHGTIISCYLAKAGLRVAVLEAHTHLGGGAVSEEGPLPGYRQNPHAHFTTFFKHPAYTDFNLRDEGLEYLALEQHEGIVFDDGSSLLGYCAHRATDGDPNTNRTEEAPDNVQRTYDQIKAFSQRDADTYLRLLDAYRKYWKKAAAEYHFNPPKPWGTPDPLESLLTIADSGLEPVHQFMSVRQIAYDFFESPEMRTLFMRAVPTSTGLFADDPFGLQNMVWVLPTVLSFEAAVIAKGGTQMITDALVKAGKKLGVEYFTGHEVDEILVENGNATGVKLTRGGVIRAPLVVSDLGVPQTCLRLLRNHPLGEKLVHRIKNIHYDRGQIMWGNVAVHELPNYTAEKTNPGVNTQPRMYFGPKDPEYLANRYQHEMFLLGFPQQSYMLTAPDSIWDPTRAPEGKHNILVEEFVAPVRLFSATDWGRLKVEFTDHMLDQWRKYAPNMTRDNVLGARIYTPYDVQAGKPDMIEGGWTEGSMLPSQLGRFRPFPELSGLRTPIKNLYMCSSNMHSGPALGRGSSYNAYKVIAQDHGLLRIWEQAGRAV